MYATAKCPSRATRSLTISWGLVNIPVSLYTGTEETRVARKEFLDGDPNVAIGRVPVRKDTGDVVENDQVTRMAQATDGTWVVVTDEEYTSSTDDTSGAVLTFVPAKSLDQYVTENVMQVRPKREKNKPNPAAERAFALLLKAMDKRKVAALLKVTMRAGSPARYALLTHEGVLRLVYTADQVREPIPVDGGFTFSKQEVDLATTLIDAVGVDTPVITDDTAPLVQAFVDAKAAGQPAPIKADAPAIPVDIMAAIQASIDAQKAA